MVFNIQKAAISAVAKALADRKITATRNSGRREFIRAYNYIVSGLRLVRPAKWDSCRQRF